MKTELQKQLAKIAPNIAIRTIWERDSECRDIRNDVCDMENEDPDDWQCWQSEVRTTCIINGEEITGSAYLGGTWEKAEDHPRNSNPEISGYENQMTIEALEALMESIRPQYERHEDAGIFSQIERAIEHCGIANLESYAKQRAQMEAA